MAEKIILHLTSRMDISEEEREIITYGFDSILSKGIGFLLPIPIVLYLGLWREYILFFILFGLLRPQAGGYHAETRVHCTVISFLLIIVSVGGIRLWELSPDNGKAGLFGLILLMEMIIGLLAPVDTKNKRLTKEEKKYHRKKVIRLLLLLNLILTVCTQMKIMQFAYVMVQVLCCQAVLLAGGEIKNKITERGKEDANH